MATESLQAIGERILQRAKLQLVSPQPRRVFGQSDESSATRPERGKCGRCFGGGFVIKSRFVADAVQPEPDTVTQLRQQSGAVECGCKRRSRLRSFRLSLPPEFRKANLPRLKPRYDCHPSQADAIAFVKAAPLASYAFCGRNRAGKSHIAWCLVRNAYLKGAKVAACNLSQLLDEYRAGEKPTDEGQVVPRPTVLASDLTIRNTPYCLMLQEFDKPRPTQYATERLFELIDTAFNYQHQIIITSNQSLSELAGYWSQHGFRYGNGIVSRIRERCDEVNLF
jgi:DNA replication protein DnaC